MTPRHSALPKLELCGQFESAPGTSEAAARGNILDAAFRSGIETGTIGKLEQEDADAVHWALRMVFRHLDLHGSSFGLTADEDKCKVPTPGMQHVGTVDAICAPAAMSWDLKSGQIYDYQAQMAAYALGLMDLHKCRQWTTHLLFCDQKIVQTTNWTLNSAQKRVEFALSKVGTTPIENDFCGWCAKNLKCSARLNSKESALATVEESITTSSPAFLSLLNNPAQLGIFLNRCSTLEDFKDVAKTKARELLAAGIKVPGWQLGKFRELRFVDSKTIEQEVKSGNIEIDKLLKAVGSISISTLQKAGISICNEKITIKQTEKPLIKAK